MGSNEFQLIDLALARNLITPQQAQRVRNELRMFPTAKAGAALLRHQYLTAEQLASLQGGKAPASQPAPAPPPSAPRSAASALPPSRSPAPPPQPIAQPAPPTPRAAPPPPRRVPAAATEVVPRKRQPSRPSSSGPPDSPPEARAVNTGPPQAESVTSETLGGDRDEKPQPGPSAGWSPLNAAVSAATKHGQRLPAKAAPPEPLGHADTGAEVISPLRRRGGFRPAAEPPAPAPVESPQTPAAVKRKDRSQDLERLKALLVNARGEKATDLHISPGRPPFFRRHTELVYPDFPALTAEESEDLCMSCLGAAQEERLRRELQLDFAFEFPGGGRQRCNVYHQRLGWEGSFRLVPDRVSSMDELGLPDSLKRLTEYHQGMVLVTGPSASGKTTTVAAMLNHINQTRPDHIITLEDPVEFVLEPAQCQITQREIGLHSKSFAQALRAALREDPDVILVGELRDIETISIAGSAAETGHLVFGTLHTGSAARSVARIIDSYPPDQRAQAASMISKSVRGVVTQQLIPRKDGGGLVLAQEILIFTSAVAALVRDGKTHQLQSTMQGGKRSGMKLMDESLMELHQKGVITGREAWLRADNKQTFEAVKDR